MKTFLKLIIVLILVVINYNDTKAQETFRPQLHLNVQDANGRFDSNELLLAPTLASPTIWNSMGENNWYNAFNSQSRTAAKKIWNDSADQRIIIKGLQGTKSGSIYVDVLEDNFGPTSVTLAVSINTDKNDTTADLQTLLTGGGNGVIKIVTPLFIWSPAKYKTKPQIGLYTKSNLFFVIPQLGGQTDDPHLGAQSTFELQTSVLGEKNNIGIFGRVAIQGVWGDEKWRENIFKNEARVFSYYSWSVGLMLTERYTLSFGNSVNIYKAETLNNLKSQITLSANF